MRVTGWNYFLAVAFCGLGLCFGSVAAAGTVRHDRADSLHTSLAADPRLDAVGKLTGHETGGGFLASGTLIQDDWVLTAAHVLDGNDGFGSGVSNLRFELGSRTYDAAEWFVHPQWAATGGESNLFAGWDLALVRLDREVTDVAPAPLFTGSNELGETATIVGFGATGTGLTGFQPNSAGTKRAGNNVIDIAGVATTPGSTVSIGNDRMLAVDFDQPFNSSVSTLGSPLPLDLEYMVAPGDSGGGLFLEVAGQMLLAGVTSLSSTLDGLVDSDYGDRGAFTRVSQFLSWIDETIATHSVLTSPTLLGDYNGNGVVDAADYTVWRDSRGQTGTNLLADGNGDGRVDADDLTVWKNNFGAVTGSSASRGAELFATQGVPEPSTTVLLVAVVVGWLSGRRAGQQSRRTVER